MNVHTQTTSTLPWHVLIVKSRTEKKVGKRLADLGFEVCVPVQRQVRQWSDRKKLTEMVLFNGYVFIAMDEKRRGEVYQAWPSLKFLQFSNRLARLTEREVGIVKRLAYCAHPVSISYADLQVGERVEIVSGSLAGLQGIIRARDGQSKIHLALPSLGCFACVQLKGEMVRRV
jgi:transcription antitermination factor NusG